MPFPPKLTLAVIDRIAQQVAAGMTPRGAFRVAGAPPRDKSAIASGEWFTVRAAYTWMELGRRVIEAIESGDRDHRKLTEHEELCVELVLRVEQSSGLQEAHWIGKLQSGQGRDAGRWQWLLERKFPDEYKGHQRLEVTGAREPDTSSTRTNPGTLHDRIAAIAARATGLLDARAAGDDEPGGAGGHRGGAG